jgi:adenine phosphoribosyltransferase
MSQGSTGLSQEEEALCRSLIPSTPDWPKAGINFLSVCPLLADGRTLSLLVGLLRDRFAERNITHIAGIDARGFPIGCALACALNVGFIMIRKAGKLPPPVRSLAYELEYGRAELEVPHDLFEGIESARVVVVDDMVATGGSMIAGCKLVEVCGGAVVEAVVVIELRSLGGRERIKEEVNLNLHALLEY